jgi:hypothetical protein
MPIEPKFGHLPPRRGRTDEMAQAVIECLREGDTCTLVVPSAAFERAWVRRLKAKGATATHLRNVIFVKAPVG